LNIKNSGLRSPLQEEAPSLPCSASAAMAQRFESLAPFSRFEIIGVQQLSYSTGQQLALPLQYTHIMATKEQIAAHVAEVSAVEFHLWLSPLTPLLHACSRTTAHYCSRLQCHQYID
jgi:hypothetical protein